MLVHTDLQLMAKNMRYLRARKKMKRQEFADYIGINGNHLYCIEHRLINCIYWEPLKNISEIYGIPVDEILKEDLSVKYKGKRINYTR